MGGGLSLELVSMDVSQHVKFLSHFLEEYPNVWVDVSWDVIYKAYFEDHATEIGESTDSDEHSPREEKELRQEYSKGVVSEYLGLFNEFPRRFLTGTDFVATAENQTFQGYSDALKDTAFIFMLREGLTA